MITKFLTPPGLVTLLATSVISGETSVFANVPYQGSTSDIRSIAVDCLGEKVVIDFVRRSNQLTSGLRSININGSILSPAEIAKANQLLEGQKLSAVEFMGCRKTKQGDIRHWISLEPPITARNANQVSRSKRFYVRHGKVEIHERQPVD